MKRAESIANWQRNGHITPLNQGRLGIITDLGDNLSDIDIDDIETKIEP
jgi:hypothetical protein